MKIAAALIYWAIVSLWLAVLATVIVSFMRNPRTFGATRLLLLVVAIDTVRNIVENLYFGLYFGAQYGLFPGEIVGVLGNANFLILPKLMNVVAACVVLGVLLLRWLPAALRERSDADANIRQTSDELHQETEERRRLFETSLDLIFITDRRGTFLQVSPSSLATLGYSPNEMIGHSGREFIYPDDLEKTRKVMRLARTGRETCNFETRYVHKNGCPVTLAWSGVWSEPEQKHYFFGRDMTERKLAEENLKQLAHYDQLTMLPNRISLRNDLSELFNLRAATSDRTFSLAIFDLDKFKDINDTLGHSAGDQLLQEVAKRLTVAADSSARTYRLGGDEFVMVFSSCGDPFVVTDAANAALKRLEEPFEINDHRLFIGASAGIAIAPAHGLDVEELISNADLALYDAKAGGGHTSRIFMPVLRANAQARRELDTELRRAFLENEFVLYFQPQIRIHDGAVVGAEALLRWRHPERGVLAPGVFIEALAGSPVATEAGRWILQSACEQAASWRSMGLPPIRMGVNLFPAQFTKTLQGEVEGALMKSGLPADALELEITENIALGKDEAMLAPLRALRAQGVGLAFDDFGTGFASLIYLRRYPLTRIKIDQSFIRKITDRSLPKDTALTRSIILMAHNLDLEVIAEGVETADQEAFLRAEKCEEVQGYLHAKPLPAMEFEKYLRRSTEHEKARLAG